MNLNVKYVESVQLCGMKSVNLLNDSVKILGIHFSYNSDILRENNFIDVIDKIEKVISIRRMRSLTLSGKITVLKTLVLSKIVFMSFLSNVPISIIEQFEKLQNDFLWDNKRPKVKHTTMIGTYEQGGLERYRCLNQK